MTILNCSAATCMYNENNLCSRGSIEITGMEARRPDETSCGSFYEKKEASAANSISEGKGCEKIQINCLANSCTYNDSHKCTASKIGIAGNNACSSKDTECSTFHCSTCCN